MTAPYPMQPTTYFTARQTCGTVFSYKSKAQQTRPSSPQSGSSSKFTRYMLPASKASWPKTRKLERWTTAIWWMQLNHRTLPELRLPCRLCWSWVVRCTTATLGGCSSCCCAELIRFAVGDRMLGGLQGKHCRVDGLASERMQGRAT